MSPETVMLDGTPGVAGSYPCTQSTTCNGASGQDLHRARYWRYPDGSWELLAVKMPPVRDCTRPVVRNDLGLVLINPQAGTVIKLPRSRCPGLSLCNQIVTRSASARRAATRCRRLSRFNSMRYMSTLTFPSSVPSDRKTRCRIFQQFVRHGFPGHGLFVGGYLMFPEPHKSGATHLHVLHSQRLKAVAVRTLWTDYLLRLGYRLPPGTRWVRTHEKDWGAAAKAAAYASKYVTKDFSTNSREHGHRRFYPSLGLVDGSVLLVSPPLLEVVARFGRSAVVAFSDSEDFVSWFYCAGLKRPPDLSAWSEWES